MLSSVPTKERGATAAAITMVLGISWLVLVALWVTVVNRLTSLAQGSDGYTLLFMAAFFGGIVAIIWSLEFFLLVLPFWFGKWFLTPPSIKI